MKNVVLIGAGHAHVVALTQFAHNRPTDMRLTLITRATITPYSGMIPGLVSGHYSFAEAHIDILPLARRAGAQLVQDEATGLNLANRAVICRSGARLPFDVLSLDIGSEPNLRLVPGAPDRAIALRPIDGFLPRLAALRQTTAAQGGAQIAVVGAGAAGVEIALALAQALSAHGVSLTLVTGASVILPGFPPAFRRAVAKRLAARGILVRVDALVISASDGWLHLADGARIAANHSVWATDAAAASWLAATGLAVDARGFIRVDANLRAVGHAHIFACGDTAAFGPRELPKSGVYAVRAGPVLAHNIRALLAGLPLRRFMPQSQVLYLVSTADGRAIGTRNGLTFSGRWVWWLKDWLDRRFMSSLRA